jgi:lipopolysaccharide export system protein LptA
MIAYFKKDENNKLILDYIDINDIIKIKTQDADITAKRGTYYANEGKIKLFEDVTITQKGNILRGNMAETDLNTGISKILSGKTNRVSGIFKETKKTKEK